MSLTTIKTITPGSPAHQAGVRLGETLTAINGNRIVDVLDYPGNKVYVVDDEIWYAFGKIEGRYPPPRIDIFSCIHDIVIFYSRTSGCHEESDVPG